MSGHNSGFPKNIGLALGSGSARGWAHIGVIRALADADIEVKCIAGTSIGSLVGAAFALNKIDTLEAFARQLDRKQIILFLDVTFPRSGLIDGEKITDFFHSHVREMKIEELSLPYCAVATDLSTGREALLNEGDLIEAIRASISVPGIFSPLKKNGGFLVDGGLVNPVPVSAARNMGADYVIAVDLNHDKFDKKSANNIGTVAPPTKHVVGQFIGKQWKIVQALKERHSEFSLPALSQVSQWMFRDPAPSILEVLTTSSDIMEAQITAARLAIDPPDLLIQPRLGHIRFMEFHRAQEAIDEGYREATAQLIEKWTGAGAIKLQQDPVSERMRNGI